MTRISRTHAIRVVASESDTLLVGRKESFPNADDGGESLGVGTEVFGENWVFGTIGGGVVSSESSHLPGVAVTVSKAKRKRARPRHQRLTPKHPRAFVAELSYKTRGFRHPEYMRSSLVETEGRPRQLLRGEGGRA